MVHRIKQVHRPDQLKVATIEEHENEIRKYQKHKRSQLNNFLENFKTNVHDTKNQNRTN